MEIGVHQRGFSVQPAKIPTPAGLVDGMRFTIVDHSGIVVHATFGLSDWAEFQKFVANPEAETAAAAARAKIALPGGMAPSLKRQKH